MKLIKHFFYAIAVVSVLAVSSIAYATSKDDIVFPVAELGGCANEQVCRAFCNVADNRLACFQFAKKHNLMEKDEVERIEKVREVIVSGGPGGCSSEQECEQYCSQASHIKECIAFAKQTGIMDAQELAEAEKISAALDRGAQLPGGCLSKAACETYCADPAHMEECIVFAEQAGFMEADELEEAKKILPLMKQGQTPGSCKSREQCEAYCEDPAHIEECVAFAEKAGLINPQEAELVRKTGGKGPGGCRGRFECEKFCENPDNSEECFNFAAEHGLIPPDELEMIRKIGGPQALKHGGPGGCRGKQDCEEFCAAPENQETCFQFAVEKGFISPEEAEHIKSLKEQGEFAGPGYCKTPQQCEEYCTQAEHFEECRQFASPEGGEPSAGEVPGQPDEFGPPPGFEDSPPGPEEFEVPPGFVPPGIEERVHEEFRVREEDIRRRTEKEIRAGLGEQIPEVVLPEQRSSLPHEEFEVPEGLQGPSAEFLPPDGFTPPEGFSAPHFIPSSGESSEPISSAGGPSAVHTLRRILSVLMVLFGL